MEFVLAHYVFDHTIEEQAQAELSESGEWGTTLAAANQGVPDSTYARALGSVHGADPAERFAYGLCVFIDGVEQQLIGGHEQGPL